MNFWTLETLLSVNFHTVSLPPLACHCTATTQPPNVPGRPLTNVNTEILHPCKMLPFFLYLPQQQKMHLPPPIYKYSSQSCRLPSFLDCHRATSKMCSGGVSPMSAFREKLSGDRRIVTFLKTSPTIVRHVNMQVQPPD